MSWTENINGTITGFGVAFDVLNLVIKSLNFTYEIILPEIDGIGDDKRGVLGLLYEKVILKIVSSLFIEQKAFNNKLSF